MRWRGSCNAAPDREIGTALARLRREVCALPDGDYNYLRMGDVIIAVPALCPDLKGLHVVSGGVSLVKLGRSHIEPLHALAMAIDASRARQSVDLSADDARRYLAGEVLPCADDMRGWVLMSYMGLPLGWAKAANGSLKNHLPKGLRKQQ